MYNLYIPNAVVRDDFDVELINAETKEIETVHFHINDYLTIFKEDDNFVFITQTKRYELNTGVYFMDLHFYALTKQVTAVELFDNPGDCNYFLRKLPEERIKSINYTDGKFWITYLADYRPTFKELFE